MNIPTHKLKVAHIITQLELGGAQRNTLYTVNHLDPERYEPLLLCGRDGILDHEAESGRVLPHFVKCLVRPVHPLKDVIAGVDIYKHLRVQKPHIVHTHSSKAGILGRIAAYFAGVPVIIHTFHGFGFTPGQSSTIRRLFIWVEKLCAILSTHLVFVSEANMKEAAEFGIGKKIPKSLIRSGILLSEDPVQKKVRNERRNPIGVLEDNKIPHDAWVVVSVGNFKPQKNPIDLIRTAILVLQQKPEIHFLLIGDGELLQQAQAMAREHNIASNIHFPGWRKRHDDIDKILKASKCFLLTSLWEGLPRALVEAMAAELPAVAYGVDGVTDILKDEESGFVIPPHRFELAAEKILWLADHPKKAVEMGQIGHNSISNDFDIKFMVDQQDKLYTQLYEAVPLKKYYEPLWNTSPVKENE